MSTQKEFCGMNARVVLFQPFRFLCLLSGAAPPSSLHGPASAVKLCMHNSIEAAPLLETHTKQLSDFKETLKSTICTLFHWLATVYRFSVQISGIASDEIIVSYSLC